MELLIGILCGVILSLLFSFGPAFFGLIQNSIQYGFRKAMTFAIGVSLSDIFVVFLMLTVLKNVDMTSVMHNIYVALIGGIGIAIIGIRTFKNKASEKKGERGRKKFELNDNLNRKQLLLHGFLLNVLNPFIWIYWISIIALLSAEIELNGYGRYVFFAGLLASTLGCDLLKCRLASLLQRVFTAKVITIFNRCTGIVLIAFGIYMIVSMIVYQTNPRIREKEQENTPQSTRIIQSLHNHIGKDSSKHPIDTLYLR